MESLYLYLEGILDQTFDDTLDIERVLDGVKPTNVKEYTLRNKAIIIESDGPIRTSDLRAFLKKVKELDPSIDTLEVKNDLWINEWIDGFVNYIAPGITHMNYEDAKDYVNLKCEQFGIDRCMNKYSIDLTYISIDCDTFYWHFGTLRIKSKAKARKSHINTRIINCSCDTKTVVRQFNDEFGLDVRGSYPTINKIGDPDDPYVFSKLPLLCHPNISFDLLAWSVGMYGLRYVVVYNPGVFNIEGEVDRGTCKTIYGDACVADQKKLKGILY